MTRCLKAKLTFFEVSNCLNLVNYLCISGEQIFVYEYVANGNLADHFLGMASL